MSKAGGPLQTGGISLPGWVHSLAETKVGQILGRKISDIGGLLSEAKTEIAKLAKKVAEKAKETFCGPLLKIWHMLG